MAIKLDFKITATAVQPDAYLMVYQTIIHHYHEYAEVFVNVYDSEDARRRNVSDDEAVRMTPLKTIRVEIPLAIYEVRVKESAQAVLAAVYGVLADYAEPHGLKGLLNDSETA